MRFLGLLVVAGLLLAGCSDPASDATGDNGTAPAVVQDAKAYAAPDWKVGQWWDHQWSLYSNGSVMLQFTVRTIVAEDEGGSWVLATSNRTHAAYHAAFTFPTLGRFTKDSLTSTAEESTFPWYRFPFQLNDTWETTVTTFDGMATTTPHKVSALVRDAGGLGGPKGVPVVEMREGSVLFARYDFDEKAGWFSDAFFFDGEGQLQFRVQRLDGGTGWSGTAYDATGELAVNTFFVLAPGFVQGAPVTTFEVPDGRTSLLGFVFAFASNGAQDAELIDPAGTRYSVQAADANGQALVPGGGAELLVPAVAGEWRFATAGAGVASGAGILAYSVTEREIAVGA